MPQRAVSTAAGGNRSNLLFESPGRPITPEAIDAAIEAFGDGYNNAAAYVIRNSDALDEPDRVFMTCAARLLCSYGMTRSGTFKGLSVGRGGRVVGGERLRDCWDRIGDQLMGIRAAIRHRVRMGYSRDRYILELPEQEREELIAQIWSLTKNLLPITMGETSYGLVGASKILFAALPEIVQPVDTSEWLTVFRTVDLGDVLRRMVSEIEEWESATQTNLNEADSSKRLTTLPSVYNVMAMAAKTAILQEQLTGLGAASGSRQAGESRGRRGTGTDRSISKADTMVSWCPRVMPSYRPVTLARITPGTADLLPAQRDYLVMPVLPPEAQSRSRSPNADEWPVGG